VITTNALEWGSISAGWEQRFNRISRNNRLYLAATAEPGAMKTTPWSFWSQLQIRESILAHHPDYLSAFSRAGSHQSR
jgi:hypothetical protein